jgi:hypothetical protein
MKENEWDTSIEAIRNWLKAPLAFCVHPSAHVMPHMDTVNEVK